MIRLVDVRPRSEYLDGHIPGSLHLDPEEDLTGDLCGGRHPLPRPGDFAAAASRAGIADDSYVEGTLAVARIELGWLDGSLGAFTDDARLALTLVKEAEHRTMQAELCAYLGRAGIGD